MIIKATKFDFADTGKASLYNGRRVQYSTADKLAGVHNSLQCYLISIYEHPAR